ncbi:gliding motility-associated C-terminal domain-containing protein [Chryseobacterium sp. SN22]|uniref:T9SS type B sorting domain-containing protein n=1 Tax=Chryseobacterium sp. SN22 TaxID=2606431 RepID=UPI0011ED1429|nr:T9SS type B sorting domain-containing protein [Chryseobacterium sp. SN22]KAA0128934.1 gliding motility-associated C-terminal domain-containing protein [Chryseobacterium sp. SN22]
MKKSIFLFFFAVSHMIFAQADCATALSVCGNSNITYSPNGIGAVNENLGGCLSTGEHNSIWYKFTIATGGTLTFDLVPTSSDADYDWAIYGPNVNCGNLGAPIRCNAATVIGVGASTGMNMTSTITSAAGGSLTPYCQYLDVLPGQTYYLYIDNWVDITNPTMAPFSLTWGGTATLASPFTDPTIQTQPFVPPGTPAANPANPREIIICQNPTVFNFNTLSAGILNGNTNFQISYHSSQNEALSGANPILTPITASTTTTYYYSIHYQDPANPNNPINSCRQVGAFKFKYGNISVNNVTLFSCNNNNAGTATFDLTSASVFSDPTATKQYYRTLSDLNAGINPIVPANAFVSVEGMVYVKVTSQYGCTATAQITLKFYPAIAITEATLRSCSIVTSPSTALFNLSTAAVTSQTLPKKYYTSLADAQSGSNEIVTFLNYIAPNSVVFVKITDTNGCYAIAKINLMVIPSVYSTVLKDKTICIEDKTTLDAGPGFTAYEWSTGATTQTISNVGVGTYWVKLKTGECTVMQTVKVYASGQPVISDVDIKNNTVTINVKGGTAPYRYSMDGVKWQDSNTFANVPRGDHHIYVKDAYDCDPIDIDIVVPNLVNVITPNGDGINDVIDYSVLRNKQNLVFSIFDRYGNKMFEANRFSAYKWDGTTGGKKVKTGTYWYSVSWNENDKKNTLFRYSGWVMVKNRE